MELVKQRGWSERQPMIRHWRDRNGVEVDLIIEDDSGSIAGVDVKAASAGSPRDVKAASAVSPRDVKHLQDLRDKLGDRFTAGVGIDANVNDR